MSRISRSAKKGRSSEEDQNYSQKSNSFEKKGCTDN